MGHNVEGVGGSRDELKAYQKIVMSSVVHVKITARAFELSNFF